jgi:hypothetical protein
MAKSKAARVAGQFGRYDKYECGGCGDLNGRRGPRGQAEAACDFCGWTERRTFRHQGHALRARVRGGLT